MALNQSYAVWNNKGGVGKSTITFHVASRFAETHPNQNVLVIDLCPQANASMMLLGGGVRGENEVLANCTLATPRTVVGYLSHVIAAGSGAPLPDPMTFLTQISTLNHDLPINLYLMCGDGNLEPMAPAIAGAAAQPALTPQADPWRWIHQIFRSLVVLRQPITNYQVDLRHTHPKLLSPSRKGPSAVYRMRRMLAVEQHEHCVGGNA